MRQDIYSTLTAPIRALVDEVERTTGFAIEIKSRHSRGDEWVAEVNEGVVGVLTSFDSATVEYPGGLEQLTEEDIAHELLHMRRLFVDNVPHLYPKQKADGAAAAGIDNWLEHIVIYKKQLELCPTFQIAFNSGHQEFWNSCPWNSSDYQLKFNLITRFLITRKYASADTKSVMNGAIRTLNLDFDVKEVAKRLERRVHDKRQFVKDTLSFCGIPTDLFWLRRHDVKNKKMFGSRFDNAGITTMSVARRPADPSSGSS